MKWIKVQWSNLEVLGCCLLSFGVGTIVGVEILRPLMITMGILLAVLGMYCALLGHGRAFHRMHRENKNEG